MPERPPPGHAPLAVEARGWSWRHGGRLAWAVRDVTFHIAPGERVLLLGASGSGKSTLAHGIAGVLDRDAGEATGSLTVDDRAPELARGSVGLVLQDPDSQVILARVGDDIAFGGENLGMPRDEIWDRVRASLDAVGLDVALDRSTDALSGGQKQRLALAGALALRPGVLVLDEPTANLDPDGVTEVRDAVARVLDATGATLVVIEHRVEAWLDLVDRVIVLGPEGVIADGTPAAVLGTHGVSLAESGVWVPGRAAWAPARGTRPAAREVLTASALSVGRDAPVQEGLDLTVSTGRVLALTGPNGVGKSTLGLTLAGLMPPLAGEVIAAPELAGEIGPTPHRWRSRQLLTRVGFVFQNPEHSFLAATVRGELEIGPRALGRTAQQITQVVDPLLERLGLTGLARANPFTLSGGEKRRLSVAAALATAPKLLVLDEPTFGQDSRTWRELVSLIAEVVDAGTGVVAISHDREFTTALADEERRLT